MEFPPVTLADWRAQVEKYLAGRSFFKTLVQESVKGLPILPLYTERPKGALLARELRTTPFRICMRHAAGPGEALVADVEGGADAIWLGPSGKLDRERDDLAKTFFVFDVSGAPGSDPVADLAARLPTGRKASFALNDDPLGRRASGQASFASASQDADFATLGRSARAHDERLAGATEAMVSTLPYHDAGADAADEIALALATGVRYFEALREGGSRPRRPRATWRSRSRSVAIRSSSSASCARSELAGKSCSRRRGRLRRRTRRGRCSTRSARRERSR